MNFAPKNPKIPSKLTKCMKKLLLLTTTLLFLSTLFSFSPTANAGTPKFTFKKNPITDNSYNLTKGSTVYDFITITNLDENRWLTIKAVPKGINERWFRIPEEEITLYPGESKELNYSIYIPENTELEETSVLLLINLNNYQKEKTENSNFQISLGIATEIKIKITEGEKITQNYQKIPEKKTPTKSMISIKTHTTIDKIYNFISANTNIVLLLIIVSLLIKLSITDRNIKKLKKTKKKPTTKKK